jgi:ribosomal protein S18 acetylase RimI-like enzyme
MDIGVPPTDSVDDVADLWVDLAADQRQHGSHLAAEANRSRIREAIVRHVVTDSVLVAVDGDLQGFVMFTVEQPTYEQTVTRGLIENLFVRPAARDEGVGSSLLAAAEQRLADRGVDVIALEVMAANDAARRFYERRGYDSYRVELEKPSESDTPSKGDE